MVKYLKNTREDKKMFCKNCGKEIDDGAVVCPNCGVAVSTVPTETQSAPVTQKNTIALVGFIFSFLIGLVGLICSIVGLNRVKNFTGPNDVTYKGLAIAGIVISAVNMFLGFMLNFLF